MNTPLSVIAKLTLFCWILNILQLLASAAIFRMSVEVHLVIAIILGAYALYLYQKQRAFLKVLHIVDTGNNLEMIKATHRLAGWECGASAFQLSVALSVFSAAASRLIGEHMSLFG